MPAYHLYTPPASYPASMDYNTRSSQVPTGLFLILRRNILYWSKWGEMEQLNVIKGMLPLLIPVVLIELVLLIIALVDLVKREYVRGGNKIVWVLIIVFVSMIGPIVYLLIGRQEKPIDSD
jgi:hypothetical protein